MRAGRIGQDRLRKPDAVIGAQNSNRAVAESQVDERLMPGCLLYLRGRAAGPDRLPDKADVLATVLAGVGQNRRDDPRRVTAQLCHVSQGHVRRVIAQFLAHHLGLAPGDRDENRVTACRAGLNEGAERRQILAPAVVQQRQMTELVPGDGRSNHLTTTRLSLSTAGPPAPNAVREETSELQDSTMRRPASYADAAARVWSSTTTVHLRSTATQLPVSGGPAVS